MSSPGKTAKIFILSFLPSHCPGCGTDQEGVNKWPGDFWAGASHFCRGCGTKYQYVKPLEILNIAKDLRYYWEQESGKIQEEIIVSKPDGPVPLDVCPDCGRKMDFSPHAEEFKCTFCEWSEPL